MTLPFAHLAAGAGAAAAVVLAACATAAPPLPPAGPDVPAGLQPPADARLFLEARASGVQIYECAQRPNQLDVFEWVFRSPEATLTDAGGRPLGKHFAGPTWQATDGSTVVGDVKARDPGADAGAIPWLLLAARSNTGSGLFAQARWVQRVRTAGGIAPAEACSVGNAKQVARVPYTAAYFFYR